GILAAAVAAFGGELKGVRMPDQITVEGKTLTLNGIGLREVTLIKAYVAGLYLETKSQDADAILRSTQLKKIDIQFLRDASRKQLAERWDEGFEKNCPKPCTELKDRLATFNSYMADMKNGDTMSFTFFPGRVEVTVKGKTMGSISGDDFAKALLAIWLGP